MKMMKQTTVRVLPEQLLGLRPDQKKPPEPSEDPPLPTALVRLLMVGSPNVGKKCLIQSFLHHASLAPQRKKLQAANTTINSIKKGTWSVEYYKKDILFAPPQQFHDKKHSDCGLQSLRVQILNTTGGGPTAHALTRREEWDALIQKCAKIILVVSLEDEWNVVLQDIRAWKQWLESSFSHNEHTEEKPLVLLLHQADRLIHNSFFRHPVRWIQMGGNLSSLCRDLGFESWHFTSCCLEDDVVGNSIDSAFRHILGDSKTPYVYPTTTRRGSSVGGSCNISAASIEKDSDVPTKRKVSLESDTEDSVYAQGHDKKATRADLSKEKRPHRVAVRVNGNVCPTAAVPVTPSP